MKSRLAALSVIAVVLSIASSFGMPPTTTIRARDAVKQATMAATESPPAPVFDTGIDPAGLESISPTNAQRIQPLARFGRGNVNGMAWSPDGSTLAVSSDLGIWLYAADRLDGEPRLWSISPYPAARIAFSPDGKLLASTADGDLVFGQWTEKIWVWDVQSGKLAATFKYQDQTIISLAFSPDSTLLAAGTAYGAIQVWNLETKQNVAILHGSKDTVYGVAFSPDGKTLAATTQSDVVNLWDVQTRHIVSVLKMPQAWAENLAYSPDGTLLVTAESQSVYVWDVQSATVMGTFALDDIHSDIRSVAFSPDGKLVAFGVEGEGYGNVGIWDVTSRKVIATWKGHHMGVAEVAFSPDGKRLASASYDSSVRVWDVASGQTVYIVNDNGNIVQNVAFSPDGKTLAALGMNMAVRLWDVRSGKNIATLGGANGDLGIAGYGLAYSPDGKLVAAASPDNTLTLWDTQSGQRVKVIPGDPAYAVAFSPDGKLLATSNETVKLWNLASYQLITTLGEPSDEYTSRRVTTIAFSPDGKLLAAGGDVTQTRTWVTTPMLHLWTVADQKLVANQDNNVLDVMRVIFSPDGKLLAVTSDESTVSFWSARPGYSLIGAWAYSGNVAGRVVMAFSPDGQLVALSGRDGAIQVRILKGGKIVANVPEQSSHVSSMTFSPDGKLLAAGHYDGTITWWGVPGAG